MDQYSQEQQLIAQQIKANGAAIAQLTMRQWEEEPKYDDDEEKVSVYSDGNASFQNVFGKDKHIPKTEHTKHHKSVPKQEKKDSINKHAMPKMNFPTFDGTNPRVWLDNCLNYFEIYQLPEGMWITAAVLHLQDNAAKWHQAYKQKNTFKNWQQFSEIVEQEFGADDFRTAITDLLELRQIGSLEEYTTKFQALQYDVTMHNPHYDAGFFAHKYIMGLKDDLRGIVEAQMPNTVLKASILARVQQGVLDRTKSKYTKPTTHYKSYNQHRSEGKHQAQPSLL